MKVRQPTYNLKRQKIDMDSFPDDLECLRYHLFFAFGDNQFFIFTVLADGQAILTSEEVSIFTLHPSPFTPPECSL
ncbi:hypothetical protein M1146_06240 [Patescibacteria group bacterium]|nr:hypothetical protein [Patescibacteria group bacterium]